MSGQQEKAFREWYDGQGYVGSPFAALDSYHARGLRSAFDAGYAAATGALAEELREKEESRARLVGAIVDLQDVVAEQEARADAAEAALAERNRTIALLKPALAEARAALESVRSACEDWQLGPNQDALRDAVRRGKEAMVRADFAVLLDEGEAPGGQGGKDASF